MFTWRAVVLALALIGVALPIAQVQAQHLPGGGYAVLRYRFTSGEHLIYHFNLGVKESLKLSSAAGSSAASGLLQLLGNGLSVGGSGTLDDHVVSVDSNGVATINETIASFPLTETLAGKTQKATEPTTTTVVQIAPNGASHALNSNTLGSIFVGVGSLPSGPVRPGAQWSSTSNINLSSVSGSTMGSNGVPLPPLKVTVQNTFTGYGQAAGELVAIIESAENFTYTTTDHSGSSPTTTTVTALATGHMLFGLESGAPVLQGAHEDVSAVVKGTDASGKPQSLTVRITVDTTLQK